MIGSFGSVIFDVSESKVFTFDEFKRQTQAKFGTHELLGKKPKIEFIAPGLDSISFQIVLHASLGIDIATELKTLREINNKGEYYPLIFGEESLGNFVIESLSESWWYIDKQGKPQVVALDVSLKEYYIEAVSTKEIKKVLKTPKTDKLTNLVNKIKTAAKKINLVTKQIKALAQVGLSITNSVHLAATGLNSFLGTLGSISSFSNSKLTSLKLLGLNGNSLTNLISSSPIKAVTNVLDAINSTTIKYRSTAVSNIFGTMHKGFIIPLAKASTTLKGLIS